MLILTDQVLKNAIFSLLKSFNDKNILVIQLLDGLTDIGINSKRMILLPEYN